VKISLVITPRGTSYFVSLLAPVTGFVHPGFLALQPFVTIAVMNSASFERCTLNNVGGDQTNIKNYTIVLPAEWGFWAFLAILAWLWFK
jgi:hypothetical protein